MKLNNIFISSSVSVVAGLAQFGLLMAVFGYLGIHLVNALLALGLEHDKLRLVLTFVDFMIALSLSFPIAFLLTSLQPSRIWLYVSLAVVPVFLWWVNGFLEGPLSLSGHMRVVLTNVVQILLPIPLATFLIFRIRRKARPANH